MKSLLPTPHPGLYRDETGGHSKQRVQGVKIKLRVFFKPRYEVGYLQKHQAFSCHWTTERLQSSTEDGRDWGDCTVSPQIRLHQTLPM